MFIDARFLSLVLIIAMAWCFELQSSNSNQNSNQLLDDKLPQNNYSLATTTSFNTEISELTNGVWAGEGVASGGEKIYFGMELLGKDNAVNWANYAQNQLVLRDSLRHLVPRQNGADIDIEKVRLSAGGRGLSDDEIKSYSTRLERQLQAFVGAAEVLQNFGKRCYSVANGRSRDTMFVAYVSNKPVIGKYPFKIRLDDISCLHDSNAPEFCLKDLSAYEDSILMAVIVFESPIKGRDHRKELDECAYENKIIFRAPASLLFSHTYKGISLPLHSFTAMVMKTCYAKKYLVVNPLLIMHQLLCKHLKDKEMYIEFKPHLPCLSGFADIPQDISILEDPELEDEHFKSSTSKIKELCDKSPMLHGGSYLMHLVKIEALERIYSK